MSWQDELSKLRPDVVQKCLDLYGGLEEAGVQVVRHPAYGRQAARYGVEVVPVPEVNHLGWARQEHEPVEDVFVPSDSEERFAALVATMLGAAPGEKGKGPGRPKMAGKLTPGDTFFKVLELALDGESARGIEDETGNLHNGWELVNKEKAGVVKEWVDGKPRAARKALRDREIPRIFRSGTPGYALILKQKS